jgi:transcriptional regulator with XRE-family HTH domain
LSNSLHDPRYKRVIDLFIEVRKDAGLTQRDVAARLKTTPSYVGKLESRQRRVDIIELVDILDAIGVKPSKFITDAIADLKRRV